jgi:RNA polymerase sigma factor (sigma-70 family)
MNSFVSKVDTAFERKEADSAADAILIAGARSGDSSAFVELSRRHSSRVLHKIYRITNNWQDAEDVLQESLMRAFVHLHTFECRASFSTWLTSIAINTALMLLRKEKRALKSTIDNSFDNIIHSETWEFRDHRDNPEQHYVTLGLQASRTKIYGWVAPSFNVSTRALRKLVDQVFAQHHLSRSIVYQVSDIQTHLHFVAHGLGVAIVPSALARSSTESLHLHTLRILSQPPKLPKWRIAILKRPRQKDIPGKSAVELFLEMLAEVSRSDDAEIRGKPHA